MEMRREVKLREVGKEPKKLQALQRSLKEKDESLTFFDLRIEQSRSLLAELQLLTPETEEDQPAFDRRFKLRTAKEAETMAKLEEAIKSAQAREEIKLEKDAPPKSRGGFRRRP